MSDFKSLNLLPSINQALEAKGYKTPTPIQAQSIPHLLEGRDLLGIAQTGTGKTAAFSLPIINHIGNNTVNVKSGQVRVLIMTPTRELASQIEQNIQEYSQGMKLKTAVIFGGVGHQKQKNQLGRGLDVLVATPGRLLDLMNQGCIKYTQLDTFVLDEADRMLDMGFINDIKKVIRQLPAKKQTLLFSATMPPDIAKLATSLLNNPVRVEVTPESSTVDKITQSINYVGRIEKRNLLEKILEDEAIKTMLVFTRTKHGANKVVADLEKAQILGAAIHGNKSQNAREKALEHFRQGKIRVLVATDIAARGIDIDNITHVVNYNLPEDPESYVHRIGRTARAGREGIAISFCCESEMPLLKSIERFIKMKLKVDKEHGFHVDIDESLKNGKFVRDNSKRHQAKKKPSSNRGASPRRTGAKKTTAPKKKQRRF